MQYSVVFIETYKPGNIFSAVVKRLIILLCRLDKLEVDFINYGLGGDRLPWTFNCYNCKQTFYTTVSLFNESDVTCKHCGSCYRTGNNGTNAWVLGPLDQDRGRLQFIGASIPLVKGEENEND